MGIIKMKFAILLSALLAITSATMFEEESELVSVKFCKKWAPVAWKWINAADTNKNGVVGKIEAWKFHRKTALAPKWNAWWKKHHHKLSAAGKKAYWKKRHAFMKKQRALFMKGWAKYYKKPALKKKAMFKAWWKACRKWDGKKH